MSGLNKAESPGVEVSQCFWRSAGWVQEAGFQAEGACLPALSWLLRAGYRAVRRKAVQNEPTDLIPVLLFLFVIVRILTYPFYTEVCWRGDLHLPFPGWPCLGLNDGRNADGFLRRGKNLRRVSLVPVVCFYKSKLFLKWCKDHFCGENLRNAELGGSNCLNCLNCVNCGFWIL